MWCVHFPLPDTCSRASSSLGTVSPRSPQRRMMMQRCCRSIAQLHRRHRMTLLIDLLILHHCEKITPGDKKTNKSESRGCSLSHTYLICLNYQTFTMVSNRATLLRNHPVCMFDQNFRVHIKSVDILVWIQEVKVLTHRFAGPLSFAISETHTLQHVVSSVMRPLPSVPDFIRPPTFMTTVCKWQKSS